MLLMSVCAGLRSRDGAGPILAAVMSVNPRAIVRLPTALGRAWRWRSGRMISMVLAHSELRGCDPAAQRHADCKCKHESTHGIQKGKG
jgi:hypothetical protein